MQLMSLQHGVASTAQARGLGVTWRMEQRLRADGAVWSPCPGVLVTGGSPITFHRRAMAASLTRGVIAISHGAAARLHGLDSFDRHDTVDVLGARGANPHERLGVAVHRTRGDIDGHVTMVDGIRVLTVASTLALLAPSVGIGPTTRALDSALRAASAPMSCARWRRPGKAEGPVRPRC